MTAGHKSTCWLQAMEAAAAALQETLQSPNIDAAAASDAIKHLLSLQAVGLQSIQSIDPVKMYIERQVASLQSNCCAAGKSTPRNKACFLVHEVPLEPSIKAFEQVAIFNLVLCKAQQVTS